ncbi:sugar phosphate isomerase/epimerase [Prosthecochloris sp. N3]|uniref:Sugar phosphate isomerase/epimerase n=1 Tax=Prosthecochloris ethylica TaxID=2743976 RepID=A0ABR9XV62_9CHLB|nr:cobamide remodeling phosphodiesterase CbiR [Prosthecochloris ethylica]MBF0587127.1 sugar phosphate isomerase/epimerase [Prosthecochloris ethylica]MBF0637645.1 sugar phosphate isomerase/epimerase [Prosthecochloris ethylica]NUK48069.1 sugar phosphate isomerase/epimerase [Prosthecochloris ethylica]
MTECKQRFPFRLGTTSYIIPDDILPNIHYLKDKVDDVELVLFESDEISNLPSAQDIRELQAIGREYDLTYSIHLPLDVYLGHPDERVRDRSVGKCLRVIELTSVLSPSAYVMHGEAGEGVDVNGFSDRERHMFRESMLSSIDLLLARTSAAPEEFALETLNYPFAIVDPVVRQFGLSVTLDIGHLELYGFPVGEHLQRYLPLARVMHMHGIRDGRDHTGLQHMRPETLDMVMRALQDHPDPRRVFTMEIFSEKSFLASCERMQDYRTDSGPSGSGGLEGS